jgi:hypothetical protein
MTFLMFLARYVVFDLQESPKYLIAKGRDQEAIEVRFLQRNLTMMLNHAGPLDRYFNTSPSETAAA